MDDFGVGHSSLLYLKAYPITTLKIDGSLSRDVVKSPLNLELISMIHHLCDSLDIKAVVEYVDNREQLEKLLSIGEFLIQNGGIGLFVTEIFFQKNCHLDKNTI